MSTTLVPMHEAFAAVARSLRELFPPMSPTALAMWNAVMETPDCDSAWNAFLDACAEGNCEYIIPMATIGRHSKRLGRDVMVNLSAAFVGEPRP